ncbi:MAG: hypothetical protein ACI9U2_004108 [Bradymonadia bacterium]|jgi:hypothetical protein
MFRRLVMLIPILLWVGCDDAADSNPPDDPVIGMGDECAGEAMRCAGDIVQACAAGVWVDAAACAPDQQCADGVCVGECVANCAERSCGSDGCGGTCGTCEDPATCGADGQCASPAAACGDDVCNGDETCSTCAVDCGNCCGDGVCGADETCVSCAADCGCTDPEVCDADRAQCAGCAPQCDGRACGDDGCGGSCGACGDAACVDGLCAVECMPTCDGRLCGTDGCGGNCGVCNDNQACDAAGQCVAPPEACGDAQCGDGEDCSTCAQDCGDCCGDGRCAAVENCTACAADCACPDGERCADDRRACVAVCVPQCNGRNCGDDGCGGDCGQCDDAQACDAGVCVDICQPDCTDRACGGDGCMGRCGECDAGAACDEGVCEAVCQPNCMGLECGADGCGGVCGVCEGDETCHRAGACRLPLVIDAPGVYPREGSRDEGRLLLAERSLVTLRLSGADGACTGLNRIILYTPDDVFVRSARDTEDTPCAALSMPLNAGEYKVFLEFFEVDAAYTLTAEFEPIDDTINAPGVYERLPVNGDDAVTIQVAEPSVLAVIASHPDAVVCPYSATLELTQGGQLLGNGVSRRGGNGCGRLLVEVQPGEYSLQLYNDEPDRPLERYWLQIAMTPMGPAELDDDAVIGRPGAVAGEPDEITLNIAGPSLLRFRIEDGLGHCVAYRYGIDQPDIFNDARCVDFARQMPHPGGEVTLFLDAEMGLGPYVFLLDIEPIPTGDAFLPRSPILRPEIDGDSAFVFVEVPSRVDFTLEGLGAPCDSGISRTQHEGYGPGNGGVADGPCAWSALLDPGLHGFSYSAAEMPRGVPMDRRITVTPLDVDIPGPGVYGRARALELESTPFVLDVPQVVRITALRRDLQACIAYDFAIVSEDGRRVEPQMSGCRALVALLPAGAYRFERQGDAADFHFEFVETVQGSASVLRPATDIRGEVLHLSGPPDAVLYLSQFVDGVCPPMGSSPQITNLDGDTTAFDCSVPGLRDLNGHALLWEAGARIPERSFVMRWDVPQPVPFEAQFAADAPFEVTTAAVDAPGLVLVEQSPCGDVPTIRNVNGLLDRRGQPVSKSSRCATAFMAAPGLYSMTRLNPDAPTTWSVTQPGNPLDVPEQRPMPRIAFDGTYAAPINVDRAGRLHVRLTQNGGNCFLADRSWTLFSEDGREGQRVNQCEKVIVTEADQPVGVLIGPPAGVIFSGVISTWWE